MRIAIVTGASSGLGREFVRQLVHFYRHLDEIWIVARRKERLQALKKELEGEIYLRVFAGDLEEELIYLQIKNRLENQSPDVRMLVNAAGFGRRGTVEEIFASDPEAQLRMIDLNCRALTKMTGTCLPWLHKGSRILNVASAAAFCPQSGSAVYAATKAYVLSFSRGLGAELYDRGIYVTAVCPGPVDTEFFETAGSIEGSFKEAFLGQSRKVVQTALLDARAKKEVSVCGTSAKGARAAAKLLPHGLILEALDSLRKWEDRNE